MSASVWKRSSFYQIGEVILGGTPSTKKLEYWNGDIPFVTPNDLSDTNSPFIAKTVRNITKLGLSKSSGNLLLENTLVISTRAPIGYMAVTLGECVTNQGCKSIVFDENQYPLFHYYNTHNYIAKMKSLGSGTTFAEISKSDLEKIKVVYPQSLAEQKHISDILSSCDSVIQNTQKVIDKYKAIKQGMMQDLFTCGLTKDGKLRPSYQEAPELYKPSELGMIPKEWEVVSLGKLVTMHARIGWQNLRTTEFLDNGDYYLITGTDFENGQVNYETCYYVDKNRFDQDPKIQLEVGSVLITKDGTLGKIAYVDKLDKPATLNAGVFNVLPRNSDINNRFLYHYLISPALMNYATIRATGGTIKHLNQNILDKFPMIEPEIGEQIAIAKRLSSIDSAIQKEEAMLEKYKNIKTGLMARLLTPPQDAQIIDETEE